MFLTPKNKRLKFHFSFYFPKKFYFYAPKESKQLQPTALGVNMFLDNELLLASGLVDIRKLFILFFFLFFYQQHLLGCFKPSKGGIIQYVEFDLVRGTCFGPERRFIIKRSSPIVCLERAFQFNQGVVTPLAPAPSLSPVHPFNVFCFLSLILFSK